MVMVTRPYFPHQEQSFRRSNCRGPSDYHSSHDRYLPPVHNERSMSRTFPVPSQESRQNEQDSDKGAGNQQPRRRIAVACGRCRKRKIRCSGDKGNGSSCDNCKSAGNDSCQFLRVQSDECSLFTAPAEFPYSEDSRASQCRLMPPSYNYYGNGVTQYPQVNSMSHGGTPYRTTSVSNFQWPGHHSGKSVYSIPLGSEFGDEGVDYSPQLQGASYRMSSQEHLNIPSNSLSQTNQRLWTPGANAMKHSTSGMSSSLFEQDLAAPYTAPQIAYSSQSFPLRPAPHVDTGNFSLRNLASSLPNASPINDRLLPVPPVARQGSQINSTNFTRSTENLLPVTSSYQQNCETITTQDETPIHSTDNDATNSSLGSHQMLSYIPLSSGPDTASQTSTHISYGSQGHLTSSQSHQSLYNSGNDGLYPMSMPSEQPAYHFPGRDSASGRNSIDGTLSSGHIYKRPPHGDPNATPIPAYERRSSTSHEVMAHRSSANDLRA